MNDDQHSMLTAHLRAIRTAIVGLALTVLAAAMIIIDAPYGYPLFLLSLTVCVYAFVPPLTRT
jgi:hypothetical protein